MVDYVIIEASVPGGRVRMRFPSTMSSVDRARFFAEMAKVESAHRIDNNPPHTLKKVDDAT